MIVNDSAHLLDQLLAFLNLTMLLTQLEIVLRNRVLDLGCQFCGG